MPLKTKDADILLSTLRDAVGVIYTSGQDVFDIVEVLKGLKLAFEHVFVTQKKTPSRPCYNSSWKRESGLHPVQMHAQQIPQISYNLPYADSDKIMI